MAPCMHDARTAAARLLVLSRASLGRPGGMIRGPGRDTLDPPMVQDLPRSTPRSERNQVHSGELPAHSFPILPYLNDHFVLEQDLGDRFRPLAVLPKRGFHMWPRYLYRLDPATLGLRRTERPLSIAAAWNRTHPTGFPSHFPIAALVVVATRAQQPVVCRPAWRVGVRDTHVLSCRLGAHRREDASSGSLRGVRSRGAEE